MAPACPTDFWGSVPTSHTRPDRNSSRGHREHTWGIQGQGRERGGAGAQRGGRHRRAWDVKGKVAEWSEITPLPLLEQRPAERSNGRWETRRWILRIGREIGVMCRTTPQPRRTSAPRRFTGAGFTPTLAHTSTANLGTTRCGKGGGVTSRSCRHGAMTRQVGRSGDDL